MRDYIEKEKKHAAKMDITRNFETTLREASGNFRRTKNA